MLLQNPGICTAQVPLELRDEEITTYLEKLFDALNSCDAEWLSEQFLEGFQARIIASDHSSHILGPNEYLQRFQEGCQPRQYLPWDRTTVRISREGTRASVTWQLSWGQPEHGQPSRLRIRDRTDLGRCSWVICLAGLEEHTEEFVPGAERSYWVSPQEPGLLEKMAGFRQTIADAIHRRLKPRPAETAP